MTKVYNAARCVLLLIVVISAFGTVPYLPSVLLVLGEILEGGSSPDENKAVMLIVVVLTVGSKALGDIPTIGSYLSTAFGGLGVAAVGASVMAITLSLLRRIKSDWMPAKAD